MKEKFDNLSEEEKELFRDLKQYYKKIKRCKNCGILYGSDREYKGKPLCPNCDKKFKRKEK